LKGLEVLKLLKILHIEGKVFSGRGEGAKFIEPSWVRSQIAEKLGFIPYLGTLNIRVAKGNINLKLLRKTTGIEILPTRGFCHGKCFKSYFMDDMRCVIVIPEVENYPEDVIEVIAPVNLREKFKLKDGDMVKVKIML